MKLSSTIWNNTSGVTVLGFALYGLLSLVVDVRSQNPGPAHTLPSGAPSSVISPSPVGPASSAEICILKSPRMIWGASQSTGIRFSHTAHEEVGPRGCDECHDTIAAEHPDPLLTAPVAHGVCRACHSPGGPTQRVMGCNDYHRSLDELQDAAGSIRP